MVRYEGIILDKVFIKIVKILFREIKNFDSFLYNSLKGLKFKVSNNSIRLNDPRNSYNGYVFKLKVINSPFSNNIEEIYYLDEIYNYYYPYTHTLYLDDYLIIDSDLLELSNLVLRTFLFDLLNSEFNNEKIIDQINNIFRSHYYFQPLAISEVVNFYSTPGSFILDNEEQERRKLFVYSLKKLGLKEYYDKLSDFEIYLLENSDNLYNEIYGEIYEEFKLENDLEFDKKIKKIMEKLEYVPYLSLEKFYRITLNPFKKLRIKRKKELFESFLDLPLYKVNYYNAEEFVGKGFKNILSSILSDYSKKDSTIKLKELIEQHINHKASKNFKVNKNKKFKDLY